MDAIHDAAYYHNLSSAEVDSDRFNETTTFIPFCSFAGPTKEYEQTTGRRTLCFYYARLLGNPFALTTKGKDLGEEISLLLEEVFTNLEKPPSRNIGHSLL